MARHKLSLVKIRNRTKPGILGDGAGLWLRVARGGSKSWSLRYMLRGQAREIGLGGWPDRSLEDARKIAHEYRALLLSGIDPQAEREAKRQAAAFEAAKTISFEKMAAAYIATKSVGWKNHKHGGQWEKTLSMYAFPELGNIPVRSIKPEDVARALSPIWLRIPETASRLRGRIESILSNATTLGYRSGDNPAQLRHMEHLLPEQPKKSVRVKHFRALPFDDTGDFITRLRLQPGVAAIALEFTILTAARSGEVRGARWEEFDFETRTWMVPAERMKAKRIHLVPLSPRAIEILESLRGKNSTGLVFSTKIGGPALSDMALTAVLRRMEVDATVHGFRSTFRDWIGERTAFPSDVAEAALAHTLKDKTAAAYQRGSLFEKRRVLMEAWATFCERPDSGGSVISFTSQGMAVNHAQA